MKKLVLILALTSILVPQANAQGIMKRMMANLYGGPKIEANVSNFFFSDIPGLESKMKIGGSAGGFIGLRMSEHFAIQEDILVHYKVSGLEQNGIKGDFEYLGAELTFYAVGSWKLYNGGHLSVGAGPFAGYGLSAKYKVDGKETDLYEKDGNGNTPLTPLNIGAALTVGYEFKCDLQINASYKLGIMNMLDSYKTNASMRPGTLSVGIGYRFGK